MDNYLGDNFSWIKVIGLGIIFLILMLIAGIVL